MKEKATTVSGRCGAGLPRFIPSLPIRWLLPVAKAGKVVGRRGFVKPPSRRGGWPGTFQAGGGPRAGRKMDGRRKFLAQRGRKLKTCFGNPHAHANRPPSARRVAGTFPATGDGLAPLAGRTDRTPRVARAAAAGMRPAGRGDGAVEPGRDAARAGRRAAGDAAAHEPRARGEPRAGRAVVARGGGIFTGALVFCARLASGDGGGFRRRAARDVEPAAVVDGGVAGGVRRRAELVLPAGHRALGGG